MWSALNVSAQLRYRMDSYDNLKNSKIVKPFLRELFLMTDLITSGYMVTQLPIYGSLYVIKRLPVSKLDSKVYKLKLLCCDCERLIVVLVPKSITAESYNSPHLNVGWVFVPNKFFITKCYAGDAKENQSLTVCFHVLSFFVVYSPHVALNRFTQKLIYNFLTQNLLTCDPLVKPEENWNLTNVTSSSKLGSLSLVHSSKENTIRVAPDNACYTHLSTIKNRTIIINTPLQTSFSENTQNHADPKDFDKNSRMEKFSTPVVLKTSNGNSQHLKESRSATVETMCNIENCKVVSEKLNKVIFEPFTALEKSGLCSIEKQKNSLSNSFENKEASKFTLVKDPRRSSEILQDDFFMCIPQNKPISKRINSSSRLSNASRSSSLSNRESIPPFLLTSQRQPSEQATSARNTIETTRELCLVSEIKGTYKPISLDNNEQICENVLINHQADYDILNATKKRQIEMQSENGSENQESMHCMQIDSVKTKPFTVNKAAENTVLSDLNAKAEKMHRKRKAPYSRAKAAKKLRSSNHPLIVKSLQYRAIDICYNNLNLI